MANVKTPHTANFFNLKLKDMKEDLETKWRLMSRLSDYFYNREDLYRIEFDQYGRPYIQDGGRWMLRKKSGYNYQIKN